LSAAGSESARRFGWESDGGLVFTLLQTINAEIIISKNINNSKRFFFKLLFPFPIKRYLHQKYRNIRLFLYYYPLIAESLGRFRRFKRRKTQKSSGYFMVFSSTLTTMSATVFNLTLSMRAIPSGNSCPVPTKTGYCAMVRAGMSAFTKE